MNDPLEVGSGERGVVRVFTTDLDPVGDAAITPANVARLLGRGIVLDAKKVEVFPARMIGAMGLPAYLRDGYGIAAADMAGKAAVLEALNGLVILIPSSAFLSRDLRLNPVRALRFIAAFREEAPAPPVRMAQHQSSEGVVAPSGPSREYREAERHFIWWIVAMAALALSGALVLFFVF